MTYIELGEVISPAKVDKCGTDDFPVLSITKQDGIVLQSDKFKKRIASKDTEKYKVVKRGMLVQGIHIDEANFGVQSIVDAGIVSPAYKIWDINNKIFPKYLEYVLRSPRSLQYYSSKFNGSIKRRERLSDKDFLRMKIPFVPIQQQQNVVSIMLKAQAIIDQRQEELQTLDELIKARFVELFNSGDYPKATISDIVAGKVSSVKKDFAQGDIIKYVDISSIDNQRNTMTGYTEYLLSEAPSRAQQHILEGDILISTVRPNLRNVAMTTYCDDNLVASSGFCVLRASKCLPSYLMAIVCSDEFTEAMSRVVTGANYPAIKDSDVLSYIISVPPIERQLEFEAFVVQVDKSKAVVQKSLDETQTLFDSLMQKYFG